MIFHLVISALFVGFCSEKYPLHVLKPCKIRAETVHLLSDKQNRPIPYRLDGIGLSGRKFEPATQKHCLFTWKYFLLRLWNTLMVFPVAEREGPTAPVPVQRKMQDLLRSRIITFMRLLRLYTSGKLFQTYKPEKNKEVLVCRKSSFENLASERSVLRVWTIRFRLTASLVFSRTTPSSNVYLCAEKQTSLQNRSCSFSPIICRSSFFKSQWGKWNPIFSIQIRFSVFRPLQTLCAEVFNFSRFRMELSIYFV